MSLQNMSIDNGSWIPYWRMCVSYLSFDYVDMSYNRVATIQEL